MTLRDKLFSFNGRLRRTDWWLYWIASWFAYVALASVLALVTSGGVHTSAYFVAAKVGAPIEQLLAAVLLYAPFVFIQTALAAKRAHDRNHSARPTIFVILAATAVWFMPEHGFTTLGRLVDDGAVWAGLLMVVGLLVKAASLYLAVVLGFLDGTPGPNRFGPSPKGLSGDEPTLAGAGRLGSHAP